MNVAVVGRGTMGSRIAARLEQAGHTVLARAELADAEATIVMVPDAAALAGLVPELRRARAIVVMATVGQPAIAELRAAVDVPVVDAPVLGSVAEAEGGSLTIFADGDGYSELLVELGRIVQVEDGQAAKLVANFALLSTVAALGEAVALGDRVGLDRNTVFDVRAATPLAAQAERRRPAIDDATYPPRFRLSLARKDAGLIADAVPEQPVAQAVREWFEAAEAAGLGELDYTAVLAQILRLS
jgi:3-hydroxyisobutyrate dehydrogenase/2-hydroxy-3-oxopropionate reductase